MSLVKPQFFESSDDFRDWLRTYAATASELLVGYYKVGSGRPSMSWSESVDEALCYGWIDGVRKRIDDSAYCIRFTPRKASSIWSRVNIAKFEELRRQGRTTAAGEKAFSHRTATKSEVYAYEQKDAAELSAREVRVFKSDKRAWMFFEATPPSYKKVVLHWIATAKRAEIRGTRFAKLMKACSEGVRLR